MAPLAVAAHVTLRDPLEDGVQIFVGDIDPVWAVTFVPHGGYLLSIMTNAVVRYQTGTSQPDPIHIAAHFLRPSTFSPFEVRVTRIKSGSQNSNLSVEFTQKGKVNVTAHVVVGALQDLAALLADNDKVAATVLPPHPLAARTPFRQHPSTPVMDLVAPVFNFKNVLRCSVDREIQSRYLSKLQQPPPIDNDYIAFDSGRWFQFADDKGRPSQIEIATVPFLLDLQRNSTSLLPTSGGPGYAWFPTIFMSIEYKVKLSSLPAADHALHTVGVFSTGKFAHRGRHETHVELWTAPCELGDSTRVTVGHGDWRERSVCIAISSQMNLTVDPALNGRRDPTKL